MKKLTKVEKTILEMGDHEKFNTYRCPEHGIYQIKKDLPQEKQICLYCKVSNKALSNEEIKQLLDK